MHSSNDYIPIQSIVSFNVLPTALTDWILFVTCNQSTLKAISQTGGSDQLNLKIMS